MGGLAILNVFFLLPVPLMITLIFTSNVAEQLVLSPDCFDPISSVARGGGGVGGAIAPHWHVDQNAEWEKHYVFSTFETVLCTGVD